jgi:Protein of unknown function (DUF2490)
MRSIVIRLVRCCVVILVLTVAGVISFAQGQGQESAHDFRAWYAYYGDHHLGDSRFALYYDAQLRVFDLDSGAYQFLGRVGLLYDLTKSRSIRVGGGYAFLRTSSGSEEEGLEVPEHRAWEHLQLTHKAKHVSLTHRFRIENRWIGVKSIDENGVIRLDRYDFSNRFRYALRATVPLDGQDESKYYASIQNEFMLNFGRNKDNTFDQNRLSAVLGYRTGKFGSVEAGYMLQAVPANGGGMQYHHVLQLSFRSVMPLKK